MSVSCADVDQQ